MDNNDPVMYIFTPIDVFLKIWMSTIIATYCKIHVEYEIEGSADVLSPLYNSALRIIG